jgi:DNA-binding transcriptional regulator YbjK
VRTNPERRQSLLDAAIEVLAREGARGLTFRAVDKEAAVPTGTASNYFTNRDDLLIQVAGRFYERVQPDEAVLVAVHEGARTTDKVTELVAETVDRVTRFPTGYLALLELRLEATRRPDLRAFLTDRVRADVEFNVTNHLASGLPGDEAAVHLLYQAMNWLIVEALTLPDVFTEEQRRTFVRTAVDRLTRTT